MMLESSGKGVYGEPVPDFMIWNQVYALPLFWKPYTSAVFAIGSSLLLPALLATVIGVLTFRRRLRGTYRSEEHTSELQSHSDLVCRLLLEKKKKNNR